MSEASENDAVLNELRKAGSDLALPHLVVHYLYFPTEPAARKVAYTLGMDGYMVAVQPSSYDDNWLVRAEHHIVPTAENVENAGSHLERLALEMDGEYDGWEAEVTNA